DVGLPRRIVRPQLLVHDLPAPFVDELPRRDHLPAGALRLVHRRSTTQATILRFWNGFSGGGSTTASGSIHSSADNQSCVYLRRSFACFVSRFIEKRPPRHPGLGNQSRSDERVGMTHAYE